MKKTIAYTTLLAIVLLSLAILPGCKHHYGHGKGPAFAFDYASEVLDLTKEQENDLAEIREEVLAEMEQVHPEKRKMMLELKNQISSDNMDPDLIKQMISEHRTLMDGVIDKTVDKLVAFHGGLTPKQREKLLQKIEKFEKYHYKTP